MSSKFRSPVLARAGVVVLTALWLAPIEVPMLPSSPSPIGRASAQDFVPGDQDVPTPFPDDPDMPRPRTRAKAVRKKARLPEKTATKKADAKSKTKKDAGAETKTAESGQLKFSQDIAPILVKNCVRCHSAGGVGVRNGKLDLTTFEKLQKGTFEKLKNGTPEHPVIVAGKPDESHLILRMNGEETPRMPQGNQNRMSEAAVAKIAQWVKEGARLDDGIDPKKPLESYAASPEQLRQKELAKVPVGECDKNIETVGRDASSRPIPS